MVTHPLSGVWYLVSGMTALPIPTYKEAPLLHSCEVAHWAPKSSLPPGSWQLAWVVSECVLSTLRSPKNFTICIFFLSELKKKRQGKKL